MTEHRLSAERLHFAWDNSLPAVLEIEPGDTVTIATAPFHPGASAAIWTSVSSRRAARSSCRSMAVSGSALSAEHAYALCSVLAELRISQVVDAPSWTVTAFLPLRVFDSVIGACITK